VKLATPPFQKSFQRLCLDFHWEHVCQIVPLVILELLAFNAQKIKGSRDPGHAPFSKKFSGVMPGLSLGACMPNLKFVSLTILEPLALNAQKFKGSRDPGHAPFTLLKFGVGSRQVTSFEL